MATILKIKKPGILGKLARPAQKYLAIDIGNHTIKILELRSTAKGIDIVHHAVAFTPPGGFQISVLAAQLKEMIQEHRIKTKQAVIGLAGKGVATRRLTLPNIPEEEVQEAIRWQAGELFPFALGDAMLAFQILESDDSSAQAKQEVLASAATRETVMEHIALLREADLEPVGLLVEPHALQQFWRTANLAEDEEGSIAVLDLGARKTSIHIFQGGELQFSRYVPTSGDAFTMALTGMIRAGEQEIELNTAQAEKLKREHGIPSVEDRGKTGEGIPLSQLAVRIRPVLEKLETEISRSFDYYAFQFQGETITRLLLTGGGAQLQGIETFFADRFDVRVGFLDPLAPVVIEDSPVFSEVDAANRMILTVAMGLALPLTERFNLLPLDLQPHRKRWSVRAPVAYATLGLLLLLPLGQYAYQSHRSVSTLRRAVTVKKSKFEQYQYIFREHDRLQAENNQLDARLAKLPSLDLRVPQMAAALRLISQKIPEDVALTNIDVEKKEGEEGEDLEVRLSGLIYGRKEEAFPTVTRFMEDLEKAPIFSNVQLGDTGDEKVQQPAVLAFEIACALK
ncbi:MAG: type IV pilus assembly protein PilM [Syntrophobacterales bacterium]|jgi:type IV pilus assembly protein PilM